MITKEDPYGSDIPSPIKTPKPNPDSSTNIGGKKIPNYLKPIPVNTRDIEKVLEKLLKTTEPKAVKWLYSTWNAQSEAIKYQEIENALRTGLVDQKWINNWRNEYAKLVNNQFAPMWFASGQTGIDYMGKQILKRYANYQMPLATQRMINWVTQRGASMVVEMTADQTLAIKNLLKFYGVENPISTAEFAKILRPVIGLTSRETAAVTRMRESLVNGKKKLTAKTIDKRVLKYSSYLHRVRANRIARTEIAYSFNFGAFEGMRSAVEQGIYDQDLLVKKFLTAKDERVCFFCNQLDGKIVGFEETFPGNSKKVPNTFVPPVHPFCRCTVIYVELEPKTQSTNS